MRRRVSSVVPGKGSADRDKRDKKEGGWMRRQRIPGGLAPLAVSAAALIVVAAVAVAVTRRTERSAVVRVTALDRNPAALALDGRTGQAFVALASTGPGARGRLLVFDSATGTLLRTILVGHALSALAVDERAGRVFVADDLDLGGSPSGSAGALYVVDERGGRVVSGVTLDPRASAMALDGDHGRLLTVTRGGVVVGASVRGAVAVRDIRTGTILHTGTAGALPTAIAVDARTGQAFVSNLFDNSVSVLDAGNGRGLRTVVLGPSPSRVTAVVVDGGTKRAFAFSPSPLGASNPQMASGSVAVIDIATGRLLNTVALRNPSAIAVDERTGRVVVGGRDGLRILDGVDGRPLRTIAVAAGPSPQALAVDGRAGRAILTRYSGAARDADPWAWMPGPLRDRLPFISAPPARFHDVPASVSVLDLTR